MVYRMAQFSMTVTPNHRVRVRVGKVRKPYPNFQMVPLSMILSDLWPTFQGHDNIERLITLLIVSHVWSVQWFCFQWPWVTFNVDFKVTEMTNVLILTMYEINTLLLLPLKIYLIILKHTKTLILLKELVFISNFNVFILMFVIYFLF